MDGFFSIFKRFFSHLLFFILLFVGFAFTIKRQANWNGVFLTTSNNLSSFVYTLYSKIGEYLALKQDNDTLLNSYRKLLFFLLNEKTNCHYTEIKDTIFEVIPGHIIQKTISLQNNFFTIDKGKKQGVQPEDAVVSANGIVGVITNVSENFATGILILNRLNGVSAKLKKNNYFGSLTWNGKNYLFMTLSEIPNHIKVNIGDTVVTSGYDLLFPPNYPIGTVISVKKNSQDNFFTIKVKLFEDLKQTDNVFIVKYNNKTEIRNLQKRIKKILSID